MAALPRWSEPATEIMTALVTGASGFIGHHVVRALIARGAHVRALVRSTSSRALLESLPIDIVVGDLRDRASLDVALQGVGQVFHVAADYRLWTRDPRELYEANVDGTRF